MNLIAGTDTIEENHRTEQKVEGYRFDIMCLQTHCKPDNGNRIRDGP